MADEKLYCPRALETGGGPNSPFAPPFNGEMHWREDNSCSYCGSLNPDAFMARLEAGDVELTPTDKSYKVYVENKGGANFKQSYRNCPRGTSEPACAGPEACSHWVTEERDRTKFYFQHLSIDQRKRFIELHNDRKLKLAFPGHFYTAPFFCRREP